MKFNIGWHVLYVRSKWEKKVHESLKEISLETFLPQVTTVRQWSDRKKTVLKPLFPSYVFVNINSSLEFHKALSVYGACSYIRFGNECARVPRKEIDKIKLLIGNTDLSDIKTNVELPAVGEIKKIKYGPLSGLDCEIIEAENCNKIIVRIDSLRQNITATVPLYSFDSVV